MKRLAFFALFACACIAAVLTVSAGGLGALGPFVQAADPLAVVCLAAAALAFAAFVSAIVTGDHSWVDRLWSTAPVGFAWYYAARGWGDWRTLAAALVITAWGARLTFNFARKGGYSGTEDYRWPILRTRITNPVAWQVFNLLFISGFQVGLLVLITVPMDALLTTGSGPRGLGDAAYAVLLAVSLALLVLETVADEQQWRFHAAKRLASEGKPFPERFRGDVQRGFLATGLFRHSRHPNYFAEIAQWWCLAFAVWCVSAGSPWFLAGGVVLSALFAGSVRFTEALSAAKYPAYRTYQRKVSPVIPWIRTMDDDDGRAHAGAGADGTPD
jgi:steroid 5-alpha reductase family enzyme